MPAVASPSTTTIPTEIIRTEVTRASAPKKDTLALKDHSARNGPGRPQPGLRSRPVGLTRRMKHVWPWQPDIAMRVSAQAQPRV